MNELALGARRTFYINANHGSDMQDGTSTKRAWRTFSPFLRMHPTGPVTVLLEAPIHLTEPVVLDQISGLNIQSASASPITIYAGGMNAMTLRECSKIVIRGLKIKGSGRLTSDGAGITLTNCKDVLLNKIEASGFRNGGLVIDGGADIRMESCVCHGNGSAGIISYQQLAKARAANVTLSDCTVHNNAGDPKNLTNHSGNGIVIGQVDKCLIERCIAYNNGWGMPRDGNGPVGIWAWSASRVTIRHCISHDNKSPGLDGGGFDFDGGVVDSIMESNISFNNDGSGYLMCQYPGASDWRNNTLQNNISFMDGRKNNHAGIVWYIPDGMNNMHKSIVRNNTIINDRHAIATQGDIPNVRYEKNVFIAGNDPFALDDKNGGYRKSTFTDNTLSGQTLDENDIATYLRKTVGTNALTGLERCDAGITVTADMLPKTIRDLMSFHLDTASSHAGTQNRGAFTRSLR